MANDFALFERAAQLRYEAVKYPGQRFWRELNERERREWIDVMQTSAAALVLAREQLRGGTGPTPEQEGT